MGFDTRAGSDSPCQPFMDAGSPYRKMGRRNLQIGTLIETIKATSFAVPELRDKDDAKFVACAKTAWTLVCSGDDGLLTLRRVAPVEIISVATFLQHLKQRSQISPGRISPTPVQS